MEKDNIPIIYASIGHRPDVSLKPTAVDVVRSVLDSNAANDYRKDPTAAPGYVFVLECALKEALSSDFLASRLRELAEDPETPDSARQALREVSDKLKGH